MLVKPRKLGLLDTDARARPHMHVLSSHSSDTRRVRQLRRKENCDTHNVKRFSVRKNYWWTIILPICLFAFSVNGKAVPKKKGCVVGAGGGGLAMVKEFAAYPDEFEPIAFERNSDVGGLWIYTDSSDFDQHGLPVHSAIYKNLRTNSPKQLMHFEDFQPLGANENRTCVKHETVLGYLRNYTEHYNLRQYIRFDTLVEKVTPILGDGDWRTTKWRVQTRDLIANRNDVTICDAIIICNGRNFKPSIPKIPGIEGFPGHIIHSHAYRRPEDYANQTIVLLGAGTSGIDIAIDLSSYAKKVYLSHRHNRIQSEWPDNVEQVREVVSANGNVLTLQDNKTITTDAFIYCTGYSYDIPFIDESSGIAVEDKRVYPLYNQITNAYHPSMGIFGLPIGFSKYYVALLQGKVDLPCLEDRLKEAELPPNVPKNKTHELSHGQWAYYKELANAAGFETLPDYYEQGLKLWSENMQVDWTYFKQSEMKMRADGEFEISYPRGRGRNFHEQPWL